MERALDPALLTGALGDIRNLPSPEELRQMLADAEVSAFFVQDRGLPPALVETAWVLHQIGTVRPALQLYGAERQIQANSVAAHIFDLALARGLEPGEQLVTTFAAQVSSIRGDRTPNATALAARLGEPGASTVRDPGRASLEVGCSLLSLNRATTNRLLRRANAELTSNAGNDFSFEGTRLAAVASVVRGATSLLRYLTYGDPEALNTAREQFERGVNDPAANRDLDSRWVAAHLLDLSDDLGTSSVWAILPPGTPPAVARTMTLGEPPVMTLWPPQIELLRDSEQSPLRPDVRRAVLTFPTSAGKTLLTQLVVANHLATLNTPVCVVAPSHSLCREIRYGLDRRLWVLRHHVVEDGPLGDPQSQRAPVVVMTPERLAARLRMDSSQLLDDFGLFVLDEAHLVADHSRGWTFETTISRLHELTLTTSHRIVVVSAALGGTATVRTWLGVDGEGTMTAARWRGPRRLHATYEVQEVGDITVIPAEGRQKLPRRVRELRGVVTLYVDAGAAAARRGGRIGDVVTFGSSEEKPSRAEQLSLVVNLASRSGSVLTVHATKLGAERLAKAIAATRNDRESTPLVRLAEQRLHADHPLVSLLRRGVAYHHAALPIDIQIEIENAVRSRQIDVVCATTTLSEGVNLPVRTVVIAERGYYDGREKRFVEMIDAPALLNAAGRAGRAGRETEGWVIVADEPYGANPRSALLGLEQDREVRSTLFTPAALSALSEYEALVSQTSGVLLDQVPEVVDGFLGYCWYLAEAAAVLDPTARVDAVLEGLRRTLAWNQLPSELRQRWELLAAKLVETHQGTDPERRRRWSQTGARLSSNLVLETVAIAARPGVLGLPLQGTTDPLTVLAVVLAGDGLDLLLSLMSERDRRFKRKRYGRTELINVDLRSLVLDWVAGVDLALLADRHLSAVEGEDADAYRFEQLSSFLAKVCEHHLPWTIGIVMDWIRQDTGVEVCPALPAHLHFGAPTPCALSLMNGGVRSRRLAVSIGEQAERQGVSIESTRAWLAQLGLATWRTDFSAAPAEVADLLQYVRNPAANIGQRLLDGETVFIACEFSSDTRSADELAIGFLGEADPPRPLVVTNSSGAVVAQLHPSIHHDVGMLIDAGFQLLGQDVDSEGERQLAIHLQPE